MKVLINEKLNAINKNTKWLSDITEVPYPTLIRIVKGEDLKSIPVTTFDKICTALSCNLSDILSTEEDEGIKEKVKTENNKVILEERLKILHSLYKIKTILGHKYSDEYDEIASRLENLFNETSFINNNNYHQIKDSVANDITIDEIIDTYSNLNVEKLQTVEELEQNCNSNLFYGTGHLLKWIDGINEDTNTTRYKTPKVPKKTLSSEKMLARLLFTEINEKYKSFKNSQHEETDNVASNDDDDDAI